MNCLTMFSRCTSILLVLAVGGIITSTAEAASVYNCSRSGKRCVVQVEDGIIGDRIKVLDEKARVIAYGRLVKRKGAYAVMSVSHQLKNIRKGYPVIVDVENRNASMQWAASFSNKE